MAIRDRLQTLSRGEMAGLIVVIVLVLGGAGLWYARSLPSPVDIGGSMAGTDGGAAQVAGGGPGVDGSSGLGGDGALFVDVTGRVRKPGVYQLPPGARIVDAVEAAGGALPNADLSVLNLAAPLVDGTQVLIPRKGAADPGAPGDGGAITADGLININLASATDLQEIPGVGEVLSQRIVDHREANGPFTSIDQLQDVSGIGPVTMENARELITI
jgi:competence protein ComEA